MRLLSNYDNAIEENSSDTNNFFCSDADIGNNVDETISARQPVKVRDNRHSLNVWPSDIARKRHYGTTMPDNVSGPDG